MIEMIELKRKIIPLILIASLYVHPSSTQAKTDKSRGSYDKKIGAIVKMTLEELMNLEINTASKKNERISEVPANMLIVSRDDIETYGYQSLNDILSDVNGFYALGNANYFGSQNFGVRGFSSIDFFNNVMILINGVNQMEDYFNSFSTNKINVPVQAIDRIEIVRGAAAVVYGSNAFMGVINIITNETVVDRKNSLVSASYGSLNTSEATARLAGSAIISSTGKEASFSMNTSITRSDGLDAPYSKMQSSPEALRGFGLDPNASTGGQYGLKSHYINLSGQYDGFRIALDHSIREEGIPRLIPSIDFENGSPLTVSSTNFLIGYERSVSDKLSFNLKYTNSSFENSSIESGILTENSIFTNQFMTSAHEIELVTHYQFNHYLDMTIGLYDRVTSHVEVYSDLPIPGIDLNRLWTRLSDDSPMNTFATFVQSNWKITSNLKAVGGLRVEKSNNYKIQSGMQVPVPPNNDLLWVDNIISDRAAIDKVQWIPRFALLYDINSINTIKFLYSQSKKRPSFGDQYIAYLGGLEAPDRPATKLNFSGMTTYELNYIGSPVQNIGVIASVFYNHLDHLVVTKVDVVNENTEDANFQGANSGEVNTLGTEITVQVKLPLGLSAETSFTYQLSDDKTPGLEDITYAQSPNWLGYGKLSYHHKWLKAGLKVRYVGAMSSEYNIMTSERYAQDVSDYWLTDLNVYGQWNELYASLLCSNLLDSKVQYVSNSNNASWADLGLLGYSRRLKLTVGYKF